MKTQSSLTVRRFAPRGLLVLAVLLGAVMVVALPGVVLAQVPNSPSGNGVQPTVIDGNPNCTDLGYDFGYKPQPEPPPTGTYTFPETSYTVKITSDGTYFDWNSTLGIDAVIVKGGSNANLYSYDPPAEAFSDTGLHSPINPNNDKPYAISHIEFCYDYEVDVSKTAETSFTRTYNWTIDKSVTPATWDLFTGDSGTSEYTVSVVKTGYTDSDWAVFGEISIENHTPLIATIETVSDSISGFGGVTPDCDGVSFPYVLPVGATLTCSYSTSLPDGSSRTNTATVTTSGTVGGGEGTADVTFGEPTTVVNDEINVTDTNGMSWGPVSDDATWTYSKLFTCDDEGDNGNTATIVETNESDDANVTVTCYDLTVTKDATTSFDRTWTWTIDKVGDQTELTLAVGQQFLVNYAVMVDASSEDSNWAVSGDITISNPNPSRAAGLTAVSDAVSPDIAAIVDCPEFSVPAGGELTCTYSAELPDAADRINTATATLQNYAYAADGTAKSDGTTDFEGQADVDFGTAGITEIDECIDVSDTFAGVLGTVCAGDAPKTFTYSWTVGPFEVCGPYEVVNTASFVTNDTGATGDDSWTVLVNVPCAGGCTLTQGYWKTHSRYGPAPYDDTWAKIGEDTPFFNSGQSYYEVLWTPPAGNVYYILAHQYIAAELNFLNGADPTGVQDAFDAATGLLETNTPDQAAALKGKDKKAWTDLASALDQYNNGLIGPGHCSEESTAVASEALSRNLPGTWVFLPLIDR